MERKIEDKIERILRKTGGSYESQAKDEANSFKWLGNSTELKMFCQWFTDNIDDDNYLTVDELREYEMLKAAGQVPDEEELDKELNQYFEAPCDTLIPFDDIYLQSSKDELEELSDQVQTMRELHNKLLEDMKETDVELNNTQLALDAAKKTLNEDIKSAYIIEKVHNEKLEEFKKQSSELQDQLLQLKDNLTLEESTNNTTYSDASMFQSFDSQIKSIRKQYLLKMDFGKYESLNTSFIETLNLLIKRQFDQDKNDGESGDFQNSSACVIPFNGVTINLKVEMKRLSKSLKSTKEEKVMKEAKFMGMNKAVAHMKLLQKELTIKKWQPTLGKLRLDTLEFTYNTEELNKDVTTVRQELAEHCQDWMECLEERLLKDLLASRIVRKNFCMKNIDELLAMLLTREAHNLFLLMSLDQEQQRILSSASFVSEVWDHLNSEANSLREQKILIESNSNDYMEYMSRPELERCEILRRLASLMKIEMVDLSAEAEDLQDNIKTDEIILLNKYAEQVESLCKMRSSLKPLKRSLFSGPVNSAYVLNHNFYSELQKLEERIVELAFNLRCTKMEFMKTKNEFGLNQPKRQSQLSWVKFLVHEPLVKSEPSVKLEDMSELGEENPLA